MGRKEDFLGKQSLNHRSYEAPPCGELKTMLGQQYSFPWSKEDELIVLEKLYEFSRQNNNANYYTLEFYKHVNKMLSVEVSENQLCYMIYRLRKQYLDDEGRQPKEDDELKVLELSRKLWEVVVEAEGWPNTKVLRDKYEKDLQVYVEELGFEIDCFPNSVVEKVKKEWEDFQFLENEFRMMQNRFRLRLCELKTKMHQTQLQLRHKSRRNKTSTF